MVAPLVNFQPRTICAQTMSNLFQKEQKEKQPPLPDQSKQVSNKPTTCRMEVNKLRNISTLKFSNNLLHRQNLLPRNHQCTIHEESVQKEEENVLVPHSLPQSEQIS